MTWIIIRTSGFVAFGFLSAAAIWGLIVSTGLLGRSASAKKVTYMHESLSVAAILSSVVHMTALYLDEFIEFTPSQILVPGTSDWKPRATALGIVAFYGLVTITLSFYVRKRITQRVWRTLHFISFGVFVSALWHGISAGTDSSTPLAIGIYTGTATVVVGLVVVRIITVNKPTTRRPKHDPSPPDNERSRVDERVRALVDIDAQGPGPESGSLHVANADPDFGFGHDDPRPGISDRRRSVEAFPRQNQAAGTADPWLSDPAD